MSANLIINAPKYSIQEGTEITVLATVLYTENILSAEYSTDDGSTWSAIDCLELPLSYVGPTGEDFDSLHFVVDDAIQAAIFADGTLNEGVYFRLLGTGGTPIAVSATATIFESLGAVYIVPNHINTNYVSGDITNYLTHTKSFHSSEIINIIWNTGTADIAPETLVHIYLRWNNSVNPIDSIRVTNSTGVLFGQGHFTTDIAGYNLGENGRVCQVVIRSVADNVDQIYLIGTHFAVTHYQATTDNNEQYQAASDGSEQDTYPTRTELYGRVAAEKARYLDEVPTISQIEAGRGITIRQRDYLGKKVNESGIAGTITGEDISDWAADNPDDRSKAYNLVIDVDPLTLPIPRQPRAMQGYINFNETGSGGVTDVTVGNTPATAYDYQYGTLRKYELNHDWNLGDNQDDNYKPGQTANSYHLEIMQVADVTNEFPDFGWSDYDSVPLYATVSRNRVEVYCNVKAVMTQGQKDRGAKWTGQIVDEVFIENEVLPSYKYEWRLVEVIPYVIPVE